MIKKTIAVFTVFIMIGIPIMVVGAPVNYPETDAHSSMVTISGQIADVAPYGNVTIEVLYPQKSMSDLNDIYSKSNINEIFNAFVQVYTDENGNYSKDIKFSGGKGLYTIRVSAGGVDKPYELEYFYATKQDKIDIINNVNKMESGKELCEYLKIYDSANSDLLKCFPLNLGLLQTLDAAQFADVLYSLNKRNPASELDLESFETNLQRALVLQQLNESVLDDISESFTLLGFDGKFVSTYNMRLTDEVKTEVTSKLYANNLRTLEDTDKLFGKGVILSLLNNIQSWSDITYVIETHGGFLGLSSGGLEKYNALKDKGALALALNKSYSDISAFVTSFENEVVLRYNKEKVKGSQDGSYAKTSGVFSDTQPPVLNTPSQKSKEYADLRPNHWAYDYIRALSEKNIISGTNDGRVEPDRFVTREEIVKMLVLSFKIEGETSAEFTDVKPTEWYYDSVIKAAGAGIIMGNNGIFGVGQDVKRADLAVMICRAAEIEDMVSSEGKFEDDESIPDYAKASVYHLKVKGILNGYENGNFAPNKGCTRAECAKIICLILGVE